ncbi:histidine kinase [Malaciobacter molluscorum LMG 25693]|uniref:histidine kinase n=1 Tax=Malaciobacter molluscorum LMG 25693 TaxID=870501 RepID=A0A2G1DKC4_9BACT|nr:histidine kinase [Malaciobacter molluscorum LMG 25693]RXJ94452.1 histidine kinase [Malaciobacter molluscorum]
MKVLIFILLFITNLFADKFNIIENISISENYKDFKAASYWEYRNKIVDKFLMKVKLNKQNLKGKVFYLNIVSDDKNLVYSNIKLKKYNHLLISKIDENTPNILYFKYEYKHAKRPGFRLKLTTPFEYKYLLPYEGIVYGLAYGIIFCAFLYYFIIYFSTNKRCFLYYSIMQFFLLLSLVGFLYFSYKPYPSILGQAIIDFFETSAFIYTILFAKEILNIRRTMPLINKFVNFFVLLNIFDLILIVIFKYSILYEYMHFYVSFLIPSILGILSIFKGNKNAIIYTIGWSIMAIFIGLAQQMYFSISGIYIVHLVSPLESIIFSVALAFTLKKIVKEKNEKEKMLIHNSKLASMGEMINNIAHQWRQPLTHLNYINMNLQVAAQLNELDSNYIEQKVKESNEQIDFMSNTIDSFSNFYKIDKSKEYFLISDAVKKAITIMQTLLDLNNINIELNVINDKSVYSYENEYSQVILNLITNAKDELIQNNIKDAKIDICINMKEGKIITKVCDNAGGINEKIINKIFEPYFSTKDSGSGIGLYMSKTIINSHFKGDIFVENISKGACFYVIV